MVTPYCINDIGDVLVLKTAKTKIGTIRQYTSCISYYNSCGWVTDSKLHDDRQADNIQTLYAQFLKWGLSYEWNVCDLTFSNQ